MTIGVDRLLMLGTDAIIGPPVGKVGTIMGTANVEEEEDTTTDTMRNPDPVGHIVAEEEDGIVDPKAVGDPVRGVTIDIGRNSSALQKTRPFTRIQTNPISCERPQANGLHACDCVALLLQQQCIDAAPTCWTHAPYSVLRWNPCGRSQQGRCVRCRCKPRTDVSLMILLFSVRNTLHHSNTTLIVCILPVSLLRQSISLLAKVSLKRLKNACRAFSYQRNAGVQAHLNSNLLQKPTVVVIVAVVVQNNTLRVASSSLLHQWKGGRQRKKMS